MLRKIIILYCVVGTNFVFAMNELSHFSMDTLSEKHKEKVRSSIELMKDTLICPIYQDPLSFNQYMFNLESGEKTITKILKKYPMSKQEQLQWLVEIGSRPPKEKPLWRRIDEEMVLATDRWSPPEGALFLGEKISQWRVWVKKLDEALPCEKE